ncbi:unnamed protein product [Callosobruchus maculatus]|uniref:Uncharacterized protein n=1 Tax=Callosobruchus maculatus TaxID=64391 RepID=A0A653DQ32_CALMS|nr:unnamed protein product [Callosobruchus maculatus]
MFTQKLRYILTRLVSTYQHDYTGGTMKKLQDKPSELTTNVGFENQLLESCKLLFGPKTQKLLAPLVTSRHINGYMRTEGFYTPLTVYQRDIGQVAYNVLSKSQK